jgi:spermidine/putrescine transport system permease protein
MKLRIPLWLPPSLALLGLLLSLLNGCSPKKELTIACWSEYLPQEILDEFSAQTGIPIRISTYSSNEELLQLLSKNQEANLPPPDLIQPSEHSVAHLVKEGALAPLNHSKIPNLKNLSPEFLNLPFDPQNKYSVPFMAGSVGIAYNSETIKTPIDSYQDVFTKKNSNKIVALDDAREIVSWALFAKGLPINAPTEESLQTIRPTLNKWLPLVKKFDSDSPKSSLLKGEAHIGILWSGEGAILLQTHPKFRWVIPKEGSHLYIDSFCIPKGARHTEAAEKFINFILDPKISRKISETFPHTNPNLEARKLLSEEELNNPASYPSEEEIQRMKTFQDIGHPMGWAIEDIVRTSKKQ